MLNGHWRGKELGSCSDCWHYNEELRAGRITEAEFTEIENSMSRSNGHCMTMGTASTMACMTEALGLTLPGGAAIPAVDSRRAQLAEAAGRQIVELVERDLKPSDILTREAFENAIRVLHAISGSTNAILHLIAYAGRVGVDLPLALFDELCASTPWLVDLKPAGELPDGGLLLRRRAAGGDGARSRTSCTSTRSRSPAGRSARTSRRCRPRSSTPR